MSRCPLAARAANTQITLDVVAVSHQRHEQQHQHQQHHFSEQVCPPLTLTLLHTRTTQLHTSSCSNSSSSWCTGVFPWTRKGEQSCPRAPRGTFNLASSDEASKLPAPESHDCRRRCWPMQQLQRLCCTTVMHILPRQLEEDNSKKAT